MNRKILMRVTKTIIAAAVGSAFAITMIAGVKIDSSAQGLTQTTDASKVVYSNVSASEIELLKSIFDFDYYKTQNPELVDLLGDNYNALFEHFYKYGLFEGRTCNANFDPAAYASAYSDLKSAFGTDILSYYKHYVTEGKNDPNRQITTLKACADNGITVQAITNPEVKITPQLYRVAEKFGTTNYAAVSNVVERAIVEAAAVGGTAVISNGNESVVLTADDAGTSSSDSSNNESSKADTSNNETIPNASENTDNTEAGDSGNTSPAETPSDSGTETSGSGNDSTTNSIMGSYSLVSTITTAQGLDIKIYKGKDSGYGAWNINEYSGKDTTPTLYAQTDDYTYTEPSYKQQNENFGSWDVSGIGTEILNIPVYLRNIKDDGGVMIDTGAENMLLNYEPVDSDPHSTNGTDGTATCVQTYNFDEEAQTSEWEATGTIDSKGTSETEYTVGISFGDSNENSVTVNVGIEGNDSFTLEDTYTVNTSSTEG